MNRESCPWGTFAICWSTGMCAGMNANLFSVLLMPVMSALVQTTDKVELSQLGTIVLSCFLIGWAIGGIGMGIASDLFGRVRAMAFAVLIFSLFSGISALSESWIQLAACRFMIGVGVGGAMINMSLILAESWPNKTRAIALGSLLTSYQMGVFSSGMLVHFVPEWREAFLAGAIPIALTFLILFALKEKARQTSDIMDVPLLREGRSVILGSVLFGSLLLAYWASASWIPTWIQDLQGANSGQEKSLATIWHGMAAVLGCLIAGPLAIWLGRIRLTVMSFSLAFGATLNMLWNHHEFSFWVYVSYALLGLAIGMAQAALYIYLPELFPSKSRGRNVGICLNTGRFFTAASVLFAGTLVPLFGGYARGIILFAMAYLIGIVAAFMSKETAQEELPE